MRIFLAPMEGVVDHFLRELLTNIGGIDVCVTEFIRVNDQVLPPKVFQRFCPELFTQCKTPSGVPVRIQLLGGKPEPIALNAVKAVSIGANAIDLNFGCPAKTVNKSDGGACLLRTPHRLYDIIKATRQAVPAHIPVTAKMRLGFEDRSNYLENALAAYEAGATEITVHARSKADGYRPPAYWDSLADIKQAIDIPVIANGEIWTVDDFIRCKEVSQCDDFMLGRGLLSCPDLALQIKAREAGTDYQPMEWSAICHMLQRFFDATTEQYSPRHVGNRLKQWLNYLRRHYPEAQILFEQIKRYRTKAEIDKAMTDSICTSAQLQANGVADYAEPV
ncbi:tRNA-dihydrouridine synthase C [gamma proteobacterium IMCC1989]|nr:tRNA-dihydrouridine synthase C [gamma proteobacterium IMCC1989]